MPDIDNGDAWGTAFGNKKATATIRKGSPKWMKMPTNDCATFCMICSPKGRDNAHIIRAENMIQMASLVCKMVFFGVIFGLLLSGSVVGMQKSFSTSFSPPGNVKLEISHIPKLHEEFELLIHLVPVRYGDWFYSTDEKASIYLSVTLPDSFEIIDDDFSKGGAFSHDPPAGYQTLSTTRDLEFPFQTHVKIKPTQLGLGQIVVDVAPFVSGKIFFTLAENYSYVSDKSNQKIKQEICSREHSFSPSGITVIDLNSNTIEKNLLDDHMARQYAKDWKLAGNAETGIVYVYEYYHTTVPILDLNSGEFVDHLIFPNDPSHMVRIADLQPNTETDLAYLANVGRPTADLIVIDGKTHSVVSEIHTPFGTDGMAINSDTNTLYSLSNNDVYAMNLATEENVVQADLIPDSAFVHDFKINSDTDQIFVLTGLHDTKLYVIDWNANRTAGIIQLEKHPHKIEVNGPANEIYLTSLAEGTLRVIDGSDYSQIKKIFFHNDKLEMSLDSVNDKLYMSNEDKSITAVDLNDFDFDVIHNCSEPSDMFLDSVNDKLYLVGDLDFSAIDVIYDAERPHFAALWIEEFPYDRNEYLLNEEINFRIRYLDDQTVSLDSITIKNLRNNETVFTFSEPKPTFENGTKTLSWNQLDKDGKKVISGDYALLVRGHDDDGAIYMSHKVFSIIEDARLDTLRSLHQNMFSDLDLSYINVIYSQNTEKTLSVKKQSDFGVSPKDIVCKKDMALVVLDDARSACVKPATAEELTSRGWAFS